MILLVKQVKKDAGKKSSSAKAEFTNPAKLAARHKRKMEFHRRSVDTLQVRLGKLKALHPQLHARLALFETMTNTSHEWYSATARDKKWMELVEWFSKERMPATGPEEQELIQDKIEVHKAYAEVYRKRWREYRK